MMATELREVMGDLTGTVARWIAAGLLGLTLILLVVVVVVDQEVNVRQLVGVAMGTLLLGLLAISAAGALGDGGRAVVLRYTGAGYTDPERRKLVRRLALRAAVLSAMCGVLLIIGPPLIVATNSQSSTTDAVAPIPTPRPTATLSPDVLN